MVYLINFKVRLATLFLYEVQFKQSRIQEMINAERGPLHMHWERPLSMNISRGCNLYT